MHRMSCSSKDLVRAGVKPKRVGRPRPRTEGREGEEGVRERRRRVEGGREGGRKGGREGRKEVSKGARNRICKEI